jgi:hypothetical protein
LEAAIMADLNNLPGGTLGNRLNDPYSLENNIQNRAAVSQMQAPSRMQSLTSLDALLPMLLGGAAAATSNDPNVQAGGAGLAMGALMGGLQEPQQFIQEQQQRIDQLTGMIEKQQQRMTTLLQSQPGLFVDEEGENVVSPERMAQLSGLGIKFDPAAMIKRAQTTQSSEYQLNIADELIRIAQAENNPILMRQGLKMINEANPNLNWSDEYIEELALLDQSEIAPRLLHNHTAASVAQAYKVATERGLPMSHKDVVMLLQELNPGDEVDPSSVNAALLLEASSLLSWYQNDWGNESPENRQLIHQSPLLAFELAFAGRERDKALIKKYFDSLGMGDEINLINLKAVGDASELLDIISVAQSRALTTTPGTPEHAQASAELYSRLVSGLRMQTDAVMSVAAADALSREVQSASTELRSLYPEDVNAGNADYLANQTLVVARQLAQEEGVEYDMQTPAVRRRIFLEAADLIVGLDREMREDARAARNPRESAEPDGNEAEMPTLQEFMDIPMSEPTEEPALPWEEPLTEDVPDEQASRIINNTERRQIILKYLEQLPPDRRNREIKNRELYQNAIREQRLYLSLSNEQIARVLNGDEDIGPQEVARR